MKESQTSEVDLYIFFTLAPPRVDDHAAPPLVVEEKRQPPVVAAVFGEWEELEERIHRLRPDEVSAVVGRYPGDLFSAEQQAALMGAHLSLYIRGPFLAFIPVFKFIRRLFKS